MGREGRAWGEWPLAYGVADLGALRVEDGSCGSFVAFDVDVPKGVVEGGSTRCQSEDDRGVGAQDGIKIATVMQAHLDARARRPHLEQLVVERDPHRRWPVCGRPADEQGSETDDKSFGERRHECGRRVTCEQPRQRRIEPLPGYREHALTLSTLDNTSCDGSEPFHPA
jgi:hypothetical protein